MRSDTKQFLFEKMVLPNKDEVKAKITKTVISVTKTVIFYFSLRLYYKIKERGEMSLNIKEIRIKKGLSQPDVATALGLSTVVYSRYENGSRQPPNYILIQLADLFGVTLDYLFGRKNIEDSTLSDFENSLITASRNADERARQDALNILISHETAINPEND